MYRTRSVGRMQERNIFHFFERELKQSFSNCLNSRVEENLPDFERKILKIFEEYSHILKKFSGFYAEILEFYLDTRSEIDAKELSLFR